MKKRRSPVCETGKRQEMSKWVLTLSFYIDSVEISTRK